jgi:hypothetical protein
MKHIKAKFFLIKDYYDSGEIELRYCLTYVMWADILTKPLQGQKSGTCVYSSKTVHGTMMMTSNLKLTNWLGDQWTNKSKLLLHGGSVLMDTTNQATKPTTMASTSTSHKNRMCVTSHMGPITRLMDPISPRTKDPTQYLQDPTKNPTKNRQRLGDNPLQCRN